VPKFKAEQAAAGGGPNALALLGGDKGGKGDSGRKSGGFEGLTDLYKRIATAAGGSPEQQTAKNTERMASQLEKANGFLATIAGKGQATPSGARPVAVFGS